MRMSSISCCVLATLLSGGTAYADQACKVWHEAICVGIPQYHAAAVAIKFAKDRGFPFRDLGDCEEYGRDAGRLAGVIAAQIGAGTAGAIAGVIAGKCGECACDAAWGSYPLSVSLPDLTAAPPLSLSSPDK
jgi:hypothetical protein